MSSQATARSSAEDIAALNAQVAVAQAAALARFAAGDQKVLFRGTLSPEFAAVRDGATVYHNRHVWLVVVLALVAVGLALQSLRVGPVAFLACGAVVFVLYDLFSGVLHIVLDHPGFIHFPVLGPACLEFQWHHQIPTDIASKPYMQVCGDLSMTICILMTWYVLILNTPIGLSLLGFEVLFAYYGQMAHRMAHTPKNRRPGWVIALQDSGVMLSQAAHNSHHRTFTDTFCIGSGWCNPLLTFLIGNVMSSRNGWLVVFLSAGLFDLVLVRWGLAAVLGAWYGTPVM